VRSRRPTSGQPSVHIVELEGRGGPFQHALAIADELRQDGVDVVLHTATDAEVSRPDEPGLCRCVEGMGGVGISRRPRVALRYAFRTLPHLLRNTRPADVLHVHGPSKLLLVAATVAGARLRHRRAVFSPHNTFSRRNSLVDLALTRWTARRANVTVVSSEADRSVVRKWGARPVVSFPLTYVPEPDEEAIASWRRRWGSRPVVLAAGQIRRDKQLDLLIEASCLWQSNALLAVVGCDAGDAIRCQGAAEELGAEVDWTLEYVSLPIFVAAMAAAEIVVCPYARASQSGVLALASQLGVRSLATSVGGLGALATLTVTPTADAYELAQAVDALLALPRSRPALPAEAAVAAHRSAYDFPLAAS
jgi:glycosyltransferase involved in cell wall biosynthesis